MEEKDGEKTGKDEECALRDLLSMLNIAEKKARIYSRLLTEVSLAKGMEKLACSQEEQKNILQTLLGEKKKKTRGEEEK